MKISYKFLLAVVTTVTTASLAAIACGETPATKTAQGQHSTPVDSIHTGSVPNPKPVPVAPSDTATPKPAQSVKPETESKLAVKKSSSSKATATTAAKDSKHTKTVASASKTTKKKRPVPPAPAFTVTPRPDAILPHKRVVVFYGNPLSKRMGVLGEYPQNVMLAKLQKEVDAFNTADPSTPVQPGFHLIVTVAQGSPGKDHMYRLRMRDSLINYWCNLAESKGYVIFLDVQVGRSTVPAEIKPLIPFLKRPYVHLALDPEFAMKRDIAPGKKIGTMDASEVNDAISTLAKIVDDNHLPPKILVIHRFTQGMLTNYRKIKPVPEVQVVINMDGFGPPWLKRNSYNQYERMQPVQFTGFKLFYKNDKPMLTRKQVVDLDPSPVFITFQ